MTNCGSQPLLDANVDSIGFSNRRGLQSGKVERKGGGKRGSRRRGRGNGIARTAANGCQAGALENGAQETGSIFNDW